VRLLVPGPKNDNKLERASSHRRYDDLLSAGIKIYEYQPTFMHGKAAIIDGRYTPGAPLSEPLLATTHGMSRTPIREGLSRLWQEGYLDRVPGRGYFVARVTVQSVHDTFDVRRLLEGAAAARAAELATPDDVNLLRELARLPANDYREAEAANARFRAPGWIVAAGVLGVVILLAGSRASWIVFGLVVGIIAKLVTPGKDPGGLIVTMLLGIAGALLGGFIGRAMGFYGPEQAAGWLMSIGGAILLLVLYRVMVRRRA